MFLASLSGANTWEYTRLCPEMPHDQPSTLCLWPDFLKMGLSQPIRKKLKSNIVELDRTKTQ